jgi:electron transfer flavoprotein alpha subunit
MTTLVLAEHDNRNLNSVTARAVTAALGLEEPVDLLVVGADCSGVAAEAKRLSGIRSVIHVEHEDFRQAVAEQIGAQIVAFAADYDVFIAAATSMGKSVMPRVAALLDVSQISEVTRVVNATTFEHPIYAGNAIETVRTRDAKIVLTIRGSAFHAVPDLGTAAVVAVAAKLSSKCPRVVSASLGASEGPDLSAARIVVSGGRAFGSQQHFDGLLKPLANALGAAIGASRAAVDSGYAPNDWQVGQTGKIVAPEIYMAIGISGAIQHIAGMKDSRIVIAINRDADAPIFEIADYGLVGDLFEIVPELLRQLASP